jgi:chemotaxis protein methyltransferase WspC
MTPIEHLLRQTIGLDTASLGPGGIQRAVRLRMRALGLKRLEDYQPLLQHSRSEWSELVESVVVTESWFFRYPQSIAAFVELVLERWIPAHSLAPFRILSLPCAAGEEPYSLVMALLDAGVAPDRFQVDGADLSIRALARAQQGLYSKNSFRGKDLGFRDRYFQTSKDGFLLNAAVRQCVRFSQANLLNDTYLPGYQIYDFIYCRNLLIYFDRPTQRKALAKLQRFLAPSGVLFVSPVEQPVVLEHGFVSANLPSAFTSPAPTRSALRQQPAWLSNRLATPLTAKSRARPLLQPDPDTRIARLVSTDSCPLRWDDLEIARRLADTGRLQEAACICEAHLYHRRTSAEAYYLLGLVRDAGGDASAMDCYRKAVYLEPNHYQSLVQMALLLQRDGDPARARAFRNRAQRVKARM